MAQIQKGTPEVIEQPSEREYNAQTGWRTVRRWRGTREACELFVPQLLNSVNSFRINVEDGSPMATIEGWVDNAQDGSSVDSEAQITTAWEVFGNDLEKDIFDHPRFAALAVGDREVLKSFRDGSLDYNEAAFQLSGAPDAADYLDALDSKQESYTVAQIVLRRTKSVASLAAVYCINSNANKTYTRAQLIAAEGVPSAVITEMPSTGKWLARTGQKAQQSNGRYQITQEWWHADTWSFLYPVV
jgi:hypothetical protein